MIFEEWLESYVNIYYRGPLTPMINMAEWVRSHRDQVRDASTAWDAGQQAVKDRIMASLNELDK